MLSSTPINGLIEKCRCDTVAAFSRIPLSLVSFVLVSPLRTPPHLSVPALANQVDTVILSL